MLLASPPRLSAHQNDLIWPATRASEQCSYSIWSRSGPYHSAHYHKQCSNTENRHGDLTKN